MPFDKLTETDVFFLILAAIIALVIMFVGALGTIEKFARRHDIDEDKLADRIEAAIKDSTVDLLNALNVIEEDTTRIVNDVAELADPLRNVEPGKLPDLSKR
jgi:hypothetical protein